MNCKPDELAIFVRSECGNEGKIVRCIRLATPAELRSDFIVDWVGPVWVVDSPVCLTAGRERLPYAHDVNLRPIRPEADPVTTDCVAGVEA